MVDPAGATLLEKSGYSSNIHSVRTEQAGLHEVQLRNQHLGEGGRWKLELTWYDDIDCT